MRSSSNSNSSSRSQTSLEPGSLACSSSSQTACLAAATTSQWPLPQLQQLLQQQTLC
jgi:hypothetical protein